MVAWVLLLLLWVSVSPVHWLEHLGNSLKMVFLRLGRGKYILNNELELTCLLLIVF